MEVHLETTECTDQHCRESDTFAVFSFYIAEKEQSQVINTFLTLVFCKSSGARKLPAGSLVVLAELFQSYSRFWFSGSSPANAGKSLSPHHLPINRGNK